MSKPTPFLWFDNNAEEAKNFYVSIFPNSKVQAVTRYAAGGPGPAGSVMTAAFQLDGQDFVALNGGPGTSSARRLRQCLSRVVPPSGLPALSHAAQIDGVLRWP